MAVKGQLHSPATKCEDHDAPDKHRLSIIAALWRQGLKLRGPPVHLVDGVEKWQTVASGCVFIDLLVFVWNNLTSIRSAPEGATNRRETYGGFSSLRSLRKKHP